MAWGISAHTMGLRDQYVTLSSETTPEFPHNTAASFQVRLATPLTFGEPGWEVALSSLVMRDRGMDVTLLHDQPSKALLVTTTELLKEGDSEFPQTVKSQVLVSDMVTSNARHPLPSGEAFMKALIEQWSWKVNLLDYEDGALQIRPRVSWDASHGATEMIVDGLDETTFELNKNLCLKMGWVVPDPSKTWAFRLGYNAIPELRQVATDPAPRWGHTVDSIIADRDVVLKYDSTRDTVMFSSKVRWRFVHLNEAFDRVVGKTHHTEGLHVYSNVGRAVVVGDRTTDLLQEVPHLQRGEGSVYYEPSQERFRSVRYYGLEVASVSLRDGLGRALPTAQVGRTHTTVTLHFRRRKS